MQRIAANLGPKALVDVHFTLDPAGVIDKLEVIAGGGDISGHLNDAALDAIEAQCYAHADSVRRSARPSRSFAAQQYQAIGPA